MDNKLTYRGKTYGYTDGVESEDKLMSVSAYIGDSLPAVSLSVDTLTAVVRDYDTKPMVIIADGLLAIADGTLIMARAMTDGLDKTYRFGEDVLYHHNDKLVGLFKLDHIKRTGHYEYIISCVSAIGLLLNSYHYGGIYRGQAAAEVIADIIGGVIPYTMDEILGAVPVYGLLRKGIRRDNLRDVLFAIGGQVRKDTAGDVKIVPMEEGVPYEITADEFYIGGSVTGGKPATAVNVTEHSFMALPGDQDVTLYDGSLFADELVTPMGKRVTGVLVDFDDPVHDLAVDNAVILESGPNYAVLSGSPSAVLTGKKYTHTTRIVSRNGSADGTPNVVRSSECELVNLLNSELVADRLMAYYGSAKTIEADIVADGQKPGDSVTFVDPFGDQTIGYIADMELTMSTILKAHTTLVSGYIPTGSGNYYSNVLVITTSGTITIPEGAKEKCMLVLIGGGQGGERGQNGEDGSNGSTTSMGKSGKGGTGGKPGKGGKVFVITINDAIGHTFSVKIGKGGAGQTESSERTEGGATTFGPYSSDDGFSSDVGYQDLINGTIYGTCGDPGVNGGDGQESYNGVRPTVSHDGNTWTAGISGESTIEDSYYGYGGLGGGASVGANGADGTEGSVNRNPDGSVYANGGKGGNGADAIDPKTQTVPGAGGNGGHGGGGGGGAGAAKGGTAGQWPYDTGAGGKGSKGSDGADGIALIYY